MKKQSYFFLFFFSFLLMASCIDEIGLNVDTEQRSIVIDGVVTDSLGDFQLRLSESSVIGVGNDNILTPISGATVQLMDDQGQTYPYSEMEDGSKIYYELRQFSALRERTYYIDITLPDGRHYQSKPASLRSNSKISDVSYEVREETLRNNTGELVTENRISIKIASDFADAEESPFLRWRVSGIYELQERSRMDLDPKKCYISVNLDLNSIRILDASQVSGGAVYEQVIAETEYDFRFGEQFCTHISQYSISEEEYEYWRSIKEVIDIDGSLFDPPPGTVVGNIINVEDPNDVAVGYFSVASVSFVRDFVNHNDLDFFVRGKCQGFFFTPPFGCVNCLEINNSTLERPPYWEF